MNIRFINIGDVENLFGGDQTERFDQLSLVGIQIERTDGFGLIQNLLAPFEQIGPGDGVLVPASGEAFGFVER